MDEEIADVIWIILVITAIILAILASNPSPMPIGW